MPPQNTIKNVPAPVKVNTSHDAAHIDPILNRRTFLQWSAAVGSAAAINTLLLGCTPSGQESITTGLKSQDLVMVSAVDLYTIDPAVGFDTAIGNSLVSLYDSLFRYIDNPPKIIPWLTRQYSVSKNATKWTFLLEPKARFHDGTKVTARAVKYSLERLLRINKGPAGLFTGIVGDKGAKVIDDHTLVIQLQKPYGAFLNLLPWLFVVNPVVVEAHAGNDDGQTWLRDHEAGSGPFTIGAWKPGESYEFQAVDNYWKGWPRSVHLKRYTRKVIKNAEDRLHALERGEAHMADWIPPEKQVRYHSRPGFFVVEEPSMALFEIKINHRGKYTSDLYLRKALAYAFDYQALLDIWKGRAVLAGGPLPPVLNPASDIKQVYQMDLLKAKTKMKQSSWPEGGFELDYVYVAGLEEEHKVGEILKHQLAKLNIKINIIPMVWSDAVSMFKHHKTAPDLFPLYSFNAYPDPDNYLWAGYHSSQAGKWTNPGHYQKPEMDQLLEQARATVSQENRNKLYQKAYDLALADACNIFGVSTMDAHIYADTIQGIRYCPVTCNDEDFYWMQLKV